MSPTCTWCSVSIFRETHGGTTTLRWTHILINHSQMLFANTSTKKTSPLLHCKPCNKSRRFFWGRIVSWTHTKIANAYTFCHPCQLHQSLTSTTLSLWKCSPNVQSNCIHVIIDVHMGVVVDDFLSKVSYCWTQKWRCPHYTVVHSIQTNVWGLGVANHHPIINGICYKCWKTPAIFPFRCMVIYIECRKPHPWNTFTCKIVKTFVIWVA